MGGRSGDSPMEIWLGKCEIYIGESPLLPHQLIKIDCHSELINPEQIYFIGKFRLKVD
jgi:hypothetical protein